MRHDDCPERRVLVADDDALVREAFQTLLTEADGFIPEAEARDGEEAVAVYARIQPDIVLMDHEMPVMDGIEATRAIRSQWPQACILVLTAGHVRGGFLEALRAGAAGYLSKDAGTRAIVGGMRSALDGLMPLDAGIQEVLAEYLVHNRRWLRRHQVIDVSDRERQLLHWLAQGMGNSEIAERMYVSEGTVKQYLCRISTKLGATSRTQVAMRAIRLNIIDLDEVDELTNQWA